LEKFSDTKFDENPSSGSRVVPCGRTDRRDDGNSLRNFANAPNKSAIMPYSTAACMFSSRLEGWNYKRWNICASRSTTNP